MSEFIYLDNNATTRVAPEVELAMRSFMTKDYGNPSSLHAAGQEADTALQNARRDIAEVIGANPQEIIFTASGSEGDNLCIKGCVETFANKCKHIITSAIEHPAVINTCQHLERQGYAVTYLPVDSDGFIKPDVLERAIQPETILVSIMHANNEIGTIQDIKSLASICHQHHIIFHTDAVQSFKKLPFDVRELGVDLATFSGHKIHAPKGIGFIYKQKDVALVRQIDGGSQEFGHRSGTENVPYIAGLQRAITLLNDKDVERMQELQTKCIEAVLGLPGTHLNGPLDLRKRVCNNVNFSVANIEGEELLTELSRRGVCVSTGSACSSKSSKVSPVLQAIHCPPEYIHGNLRVSLSKYTTQAEVTAFITALADILQTTAKLHETT